MSNINKLNPRHHVGIETETVSGTERNYGIDFLKFVFANAILYYHLMIFLVPLFPENVLFKKLLQKSAGGGAAVSYFFIISGYFLAKSFNNETFRSLVIKKIVRLYPLLLFSDVILLKKNVLDGFIANLFFLDSSLGVIRIPAPNAPLWYVCVLFYLSLFFYMLDKLVDDKKELFILCILSFLSWNLCQNGPHGNYDISVLYVFTPGLLSGICSMSAGIIFYKLLPSHSLKSNVWIKCAIALLFFFLAYHLSFHRPVRSGLSLRLLFLVLFSLSVLYPVKLFSHSFFRYLGKCSFSIYVMQFIGFKILEKTLWANHHFMNKHSAWAVILSLMLCCVTLSQF